MNPCRPGANPAA